MIVPIKKNRPSFSKKSFGYSSKTTSKNPSGFVKDKKKRINWSQVPPRILKQKQEEAKKKQKKRSLQYVSLLKKFNNIVDFTNIKLLKGFLNKFGKIKARRKTKLKVQNHKKITKAIKRARSFGIIPYSCNVVIKS
jgi:ribosomal protein S18